MGMGGGRKEKRRRNAKRRRLNFAAREVQERLDDFLQFGNSLVMAVAGLFKYGNAILLIQRLRRVSAGPGNAKAAECLRT
jgi:hypothetical protein